MKKIEFNKAQLEQLKATWNKVERIDPASAHYKALTELMNKFGNETLIKIVNENINFLSTKARFILHTRA